MKPIFKLLRQLLRFSSVLFRAISLIFSASIFWAVVVAFFTLIQGFLPMVTVLMVKKIVDGVVSGASTFFKLPDALFYGLLYALFLLLMRLLSPWLLLAQDVLDDRVSIHTNHLLLLKTNSFADLSRFEHASFYDDVRIAQQGLRWITPLLNAAIGAFQQLVTAASMLFLLGRFHPLIALAILLPTFPLFYVEWRLGEYTWTGLTAKSKDYRRMTYLSRIILSDEYAKEVRLFRLGDYFVDAYRRLFGDVFSHLRVIRRKQGLWAAGLGMLSAFSIGGAYIYVVFLALQQAITLGDLALYSGAVFQAQNSLGVLGRSCSFLHSHGLDIAKMMEFLELEPSMVVPPPGKGKRVSIPLKQGFSFEGVTFAYPGNDKKVLKGIDFTLRPSEKVALVGVNGAGKTTLVKLLTRLYDATEGRILLDGVDLREYDIEDLRRHISVIFQDFARYQLTVRENIGLGSVENIDNLERIKTAARKCGAEPLIEQLSDVFSTMLGKRFEGGVELSGGEWQKIALARAFMRDAQVLILDEPTAALDAQSEYEIYKRFVELTEGRATLLISHRFSTVRMADRIVVIEDGRIIEEGNHSELLAVGRRYAELYTMQAERYSS